MTMRAGAGITCVLLAALLSGCAGYRVGPTNSELAGARTVQIVPFTNRTLEPRLSDAVTAALRREIQRDGTYQLETRYTGDIIVTGEITQYDRGEVSFLPVDVVTARDYKVSLAARVVARDRLTGNTIFERDLTGSTLMRVGADLPSVERQSLPLMATDLARQITAALADGGW